MHMTACEGCMNARRESALKVDSGGKIPCYVRESNLPQQCASPTLYQLSYIPVPWGKLKTEHMCRHNHTSTHTSTHTHTHKDIHTHRVQKQVSLKHTPKSQTAFSAWSYLGSSTLQHYTVWTQLHQNFFRNNINFNLSKIVVNSKVEESHKS